MNRDQFLDALAVLVQKYEDTDGAVGISQAEAQELLALFDAGAIQERTLPLSFERATQGPITQLTLDRALETVALEAASMGVIEQTGVVPGIALNAPIQQRTDIAQAAMEAFDDDIRGFAREIIQGDIRPRDWHSQMIVRIRQHLMQQAQLGKGSTLTPEELADMQETMREEARYLKRFADEVAVRNELADNAEEVARRRLEKEAGEEVTEGAVEELAEELRGRRMSEDEIAARARQYKGRAYGEYWKKSEAQLENDDTIIRYVAVDDGATCSPCRAAEANGPYLPGEGPMPGVVCLGRGHCRCVRRREVNPEVAQQLRG